MNCNSGGESFKFEIIDPIGHGQFSTVYKAKWLNAPVEQEVLVTPSHANQRTTNGLYCQQTSHAYPHQQQQQRQTYTSNNSVDLIDPRRQLENGFATNQSASLPSRASSTSLSVVGPGGLIDHGNNSQAYSGSINVRTCEKLVALKRVKFYEIPNSKERMDYIKEVDLLQKLKHPNIIHYNISFTGGNELFIVLELADGGDLSKLIKYFLKKKRLILEQTILKYFTQVCSAVEYIHSRRILHRDIKPANIFMTSSGCVKLGDFGLGRFFSQNTRDAHSIVGTFYYMSPERIRESGYGFSSDVWSLGCVLYELITLNSPFSIMNYEQNHINNLNCMDQRQVQYQQDPMMRKKPLMQHQQKTTTSTHQCYHQHQQPMQQQQQQQSYNLQWLIDRIVRAEYPSLDGYQNISLLLRDLVYKCLNPNPDARPNMQYMCSIVYQCFAPTSNSIVQHQQQNQTRSSSNSPRSSTYDIFVNE